MAYAAVISLKHTIQRLENPINKPHITKSAYKELSSLRSMLMELDDESSRSVDRSVINELDAKVRDAVWKVEDVLESSYSLVPPSQGLDEKGVEQEINSFLKTVKILREEYNRVLLQNLSPVEEEDEALSAAVPAPVNKSTTVGLSDLSENIINQLLMSDTIIGKTHLAITNLSDLSNKIILTHLLRFLPVLNSQRFVSVVGMAGIGKTHLAAQIYHHPRIIKHFDVRVWVRAGPKYQANNIFADILSQLLQKPRNLFKEKSEDTLSDLLHNTLLDRRYLIALDDIWTAKVFHYIRPLNIRGRFLITTRLQEVAECWSATNTNTIHEMPFLNKKDSWNLLWQNVFAEESFPSQLEKPGRKIAEECEGLPLLILAVANILRGLDKTEEYWKMVADKKTTTFTDAYDQIYEVLLPSYEYLPQHLKACFQYMGAFPQSCQISSSKLINLWAVEDFLDPSLDQNLEEFAMKFMSNLVSNSLAIVCKWSFEKYKIKSSKLHSTYWYFCVKEARKNKLFHVLNKLTDVYIERPRRLAVQNNILLGLKEVYDSMAAATSSTARSILCTGEDHQYPVRICFTMMLLMRVLDALAIRFYEFPSQVLKLLQLRYLSLTHNGELPFSISKIQQLQCLILRRHHNIKLVHRDSSCLPKEIWDIQELRHLRIMGSNIPDPSKGSKLPKLSTLYVNTDSCTEGVFSSIPNVKKLGITIELEPDVSAETVRCFEHIRFLNELESVKCVVVNPRLRSQLAVAPPDHISNLPRGLKKLSLNGLGYSWKDMTAIGSLPNLQVLKLGCSAFQGPDWETKAGQFAKLEYLLLEDIDLVNWKAEDSEYDKFFPRLRHLIVRHCYKLKKIPCQIGIGYRPILKMLEVDDCSPSVVDSAQQIKLKTKYSHLQVVINSSWNL